MNKKEIRATYKALRAELSQNELESKSKAILDVVLNEFDLNQKKISIFLPIERFKEINTWHFFNALENEFYLPVIKADGLVHIKFENESQLAISDWGIPEPLYGDTIEENQLDIVFVPLLAFDELGYRVGYGKGFYDGFLSRCRPDCLFIGLSYFPSIKIISDVFEGDVPLNFCVTPNQVYTF